MVYISMVKADTHYPVRTARAPVRVRAVKTGRTHGYCVSAFMLTSAQKKLGTTSTGSLNATFDF